MCYNPPGVQTFERQVNKKLIGYLNGKIKFLAPEFCIIDVNGAGYKVYPDAATRQDLTTDSPAEFFIYTAVREDAITLYGFKSPATLEFFEMLLSVGGIGAKTALAIVSKISPADFAAAVARQNFASLTRLPGIGKKSAERLVLELKDKIKGLSQMSGADSEFVPVAISNDSISEAEEALSALGYTSGEISAVFKNAPKNSTTEQLIKFALKELSR